MPAKKKKDPIFIEWNFDDRERSFNDLQHGYSASSRNLSEAKKEKRKADTAGHPTKITKGKNKKRVVYRLWTRIIP